MNNMTKNDRIQKLISMNILTGDQIYILDEAGFFDAPASTKYHGDYEGGLFDHSLEVTNALIYLTERLQLPWEREKSPLIVGMFHDLCKVDQYIEGVDGYEHNPHVLLKGHGEKSVMMLSNFMSLTEEEIMCIRYHMGAYNTNEWDQYDLAIRKYPNVLFTHTADMMASKIMGV